MKIRIQAADNGSPPKTDVAIVKVNVSRNMAAPAFGQTNSVTIPYNQPIGIPFAVLNASDSDTRVSINDLILPFTVLMYMK